MDSLSARSVETKIVSVGGSVVHSEVVIEPPESEAKTVGMRAKLRLRTQPFPKKKAVGQAPHLPRGLTQRLS